MRAKLLMLTSFLLRSRVGKNIISLSVLQAVNYLLPFATVPYLTRVLGPSNFGRMVFGLAFMQYFVVIVNYGFNLSATRDIAMLRGDDLAIFRKFSAVMLIKLALAAACFLVLVGLIYSIPLFYRERALFYYSYVLVAGNALFPIWLFQGLERMKALSILTIVGRLLALAAILLFVHRRNEYPLAAALQSSAFVCSGVFALILALATRQARCVWPGIAALWDAAREGWHVFVSTAAISIYTSGSVFVLGLVANPVVVGYFAGAQRLIQAAQRVATPISQAIFPHVASIVRQSRAEALRFLAAVLRGQTALMAVVSLVVFLVAPRAVSLLLGHDYAASVVPLEIMAAMPVVIGLSNVFGVQTMLNFNFKRAFSQVLVSAGVLNVLLVLLLGRLYGSNGAAVAVLATEVCITCSMGVILWRKGLLKALVRGRM